MSSESNKLLCAILSAILVYLLASFISDLLYKKDYKKNIKLSYNVSSQNVDASVTDSKEIDLEIKIMTEAEINELVKKADFEKGKIFINKNCSSCHDFNLPIKNKIGPSLAKIFDRKIGAISNYKYSKALLKMDRGWNISNLYYFLEKPKEWAPGTKMSYRGITDQEKLLNTIKYLRDNSLNNEN